MKIHRLLSSVRNGLTKRHTLSMQRRAKFFVLNSWTELLEFLDYKIMLKFQCKTTFNSAIVGKNFFKIELELTLE